MASYLKIAAVAVLFAVTVTLTVELPAAPANTETEYLSSNAPGTEWPPPFVS